VGRGAKHRDDVEFGAVAQWIMNDVITRSALQYDAITWDIGL
jgi:hypothetical protein